MRSRVALAMAALTGAMVVAASAFDSVASFAAATFWWMFP